MTIADVLPDIGRRWIVLFLVVVLMVLGLGVGTLPDDGEPGSSIPVVTISEPASTETPTPGSGEEVTGTDRERGYPVVEGTVTPDGTTPTETSPPSTPPVDDENEERRRGESGDTDQSVDLVVHGSDVRIDYSNALPGDSGRERLSVENAGSATGRLSLVEVAVRDGDAETRNSGRIAEETQGTGGLSEHLLVVVEVHNPDGTVEYLYETDSGPRSLAALGAVDARDSAGLVGPDEATDVVVDWHIPASTGNQIQSASAQFDLTFALRSDHP